MKGVTVLGDKGITLLTIILAVMAFVFFFLEKYEIIETSFRISDETYVLLLAGFIFVLGMVHILTMFGFLRKA